MLRSHGKAASSRLRVHRSVVSAVVGLLAYIQSFLGKGNLNYFSCDLHRVACLPPHFILGVLPPDLQLSSLNRKIVILCSLLAKHCIAVTWKSTETPTVSHWLKSLSNCLALEKLTYASKGKMKMFLKVWGQFMGFLESLQARDLLDI